MSEVAPEKLKFFRQLIVIGIIDTFFQKNCFIRKIKFLTEKQITFKNSKISSENLCLY